MLTTAPTLAIYKPEKPTVVSSDASSYGLGGVLMQQHSDGSWRPIAYCSRTLTPAEKRYAQIKKECLAAVWSCERFDRYLVELPSSWIKTDHKPLVLLINTRPLTDTPIRCQCMLMRLARFNANAVYTSVKNLHVADTLSRQPLRTTTDSATTLQNDIAAHVNFILSSWPGSDAFLERIKDETAKDERLSIALNYTANGWPEYKEDCQLGARHLYQARSERSIVDGLLLKGDRIIIPATLQKEVLGHIHQGHFGITKCRERAASRVWWPGISKDISDLIGKCRVCQEKQSSRTREPLLSSPLPQKPFQQMAADLCEHNGRHYLVVVDYYSSYLDICFLSKTTSLAVIGHLKKIFARHGAPETLVSDNGPQFSSSEFKAFSDFWNFQHVTTSPHFPQANGAAEGAVRTAKHILNQDDVFLVLLVYRASPIVELKASPVELAYGRKLRTTLPAPPKLVPKLVD